MASRSRLLSSSRSSSRLRCSARSAARSALSASMRPRREASASEPAVGAGAEAGGALGAPKSIGGHGMRGGMLGGGAAGPAAAPAAAGTEFDCTEIGGGDVTSTAGAGGGGGESLRLGASLGSLCAVVIGGGTPESVSAWRGGCSPPALIWELIPAIDRRLSETSAGAPEEPDLALWGGIECG